LNRAISFSKLKQNDKALIDLNSAIDSNKDYAKAFVKRGEINLVLENFENAVRDFSSADGISPGEFGVRQKLKDSKARLKESKRKDYYKILSVDKQADPIVIKKAYKKAALRWHPDKNSQSDERKAEAENKFKDINEAYVVLSDEEKRSRYDQGVDIEDLDRPGGGFGGGGGDPSDIFNMFFGGGGGMGGGHPGHHGHHGHQSQQSSQPGQGFTFRFG